MGSFGFLIFTVIVLLPRISSELMARPTSNRVVLEIKLTEKQEDIRQLALIVEDVEARIRRILNGIEADIYTTMTGGDYIQLTITLPSSRESAHVLDEMKTEFQDNDDYTFTAYEWDPASLPLPEINDVEILLIGEEPKILADLMNDIREIIFRQDWYQAVGRYPNASPAVRLILDPREAVLKELGLEAPTLVSIINKVNASVTKLELFDEETNSTFEIDVHVEEFTSREDLMNFFYPHQGAYYPMRHFFDYHFDVNLSQLLTWEEELMFKVWGRLSLDNKKRRVEREQDVMTLIEENIEFPEGYFFEMVDTQEPIREASTSLMVAFALSVSIVFVVLAVQFNSILYPALIMLTVPLGVIGVIISLWLFSSTLSLNSLLGLILLGGIVVNNAILIIDFYLELVKEGKEYREAILEASRLRLIPILMTSLTTILGMVPIALALGDGTNVIQPLGIAVAGGLLISTLFTLFMIPTLLSLIPFQTPKENE
jgi:HAE1 family hydrophobic/amphiphilic exporter-1